MADLIESVVLVLSLAMAGDGILRKVSVRERPWIFMFYKPQGHKWLFKAI
jgi:hypothetical protein